MFEWKQWRGVLVALVCAGAVSAQAANPLPISVTNSAALPGDTVFSEFTIDLGSAYNLVTFDAYLDFDADKLTFDVGQSELVHQNSALGLIAVLDGFVTSTGGDFSYEALTTGPGHLSLTGGTLLGTVPLAGPVTFRAAFSVNLLAAPGPTVVGFQGFSSQETSPSVYSDDMFSAGSTISVTAVPEPAHWLMLALGLATISVIGRRRMGQQSR